jgi:hypothetical protein
MRGNAVGQREFDLQGYRQLAEEGADVTRMLPGKFKVRQAGSQGLSIQLLAVRRIHGRQHRS